MRVNEVRSKLQKALGNHYKFVQVLEEDKWVIDEKHNFRESGFLQTVRITDIPIHDKDKRFWLLDKLESKDISGFVTQSKTVEAILLRFSKKKKRLTVFMVEMKSGIRNDTLEKILGKFEDSISRFYMLLCLNDNLHTKEFEGTVIDFKGIVFFNNDSTDSKSRHRAKYDEINKIFKRKKGKIWCETEIDPIKISVKFVLSRTPERHSLRFEELF